LGVFGAGFGIITANTSPSASDAINAANQAIRKLTNQVNHKLELLKNYVDNEFAQHIRGSLEKQYKEMAKKTKRRKMVSMTVYGKLLTVYKLKSLTLSFI